MSNVGTSKGRNTRERILDAAESLILEHGFAATSVEGIIRRVGITKGAFFYHFKSKQHLAADLIDRYAESDLAILRTGLEEAASSSTDPLQQLLSFIDRFIVQKGEAADAYPGCLFASYAYESGEMDLAQIERIDEVFRTWRAELGRKLAEVAAGHPPRAMVDLPSLADLFTSIFEGAYIMSRAMKEDTLFIRQLQHYRTYVELLFSDSMSA